MPFDNKGASGNHGHQPGTKSTAKAQHGDDPALNPSADPNYESKDFLTGNNKTLVRFDVGFKRIYARLHLIHLEEKLGGGKKQLLGQFPIGRQIEKPTATGPGQYDFTELLPGQVSVIDDNVVELTIGDVTYQVVTFDAVQ